MSDVAAAVAEPSEASHHTSGVAGALVAVSAWGLGTVVTKHIDMGALAVGVYRFGLYGLLLGAFLWLRGTRVNWQTMRNSMWGGLSLSADVAFFFSALKLTSVANATVIGALQPVVVALVAHRFFGEAIRRRDLLLGAVSLAGVLVVIMNAAESTDASLRGNLFAVGALFAWSSYFVFSRRAKGVISPTEYTAGTALWTALTNLPLALLFGQDLAPPSARSWLWLTVLVFVAGFFGHSAMNWSLQRIPLWLGSTFTLFIPVVSAGAAWLFLGETVTVVQMIAMAVVVAALAGVVAGQSGIGNRPRPLRR